MLTHPAKDPFYEPVTDYLRNERDTAKDPLFRQYRAGQIYNPYEAETSGRGTWSKAIPGEVNEFCATAYFFGRELRRELDVPVALISCNKGGTIIEAWIAPQALDANENRTKQRSRRLARLVLISLTLMRTRTQKSISPAQGAGGFERSAKMI